MSYTKSAFEITKVYLENILYFEDGLRYSVLYFSLYVPLILPPNWWTPINVENLLYQYIVKYYGKNDVFISIQYGCVLIMCDMAICTIRVEPYVTLSLVHYYLPVCPLPTIFPYSFMSTELSKASLFVDLISRRLLSVCRL